MSSPAHPVALAVVAGYLAAAAIYLDWCITLRAAGEPVGAVDLAVWALYALAAGAGVALLLGRAGRAAC